MYGSFTMSFKGSINFTEYGRPPTKHLVGISTPYTCITGLNTCGSCNSVQIMNITMLAIIGDIVSSYIIYYMKICSDCILCFG